MKNTVPNSIDIQNTIDNFEAVIASGHVKLIAQNGELNHSALEVQRLRLD